MDNREEKDMNSVLEKQNPLLEAKKLLQEAMLKTGRTSKDVKKSIEENYKK
jgi:hypothetical protein